SSPKSNLMMAASGEWLPTLPRILSVICSRVMVSSLAGNGTDVYWTAWSRNQHESSVAFFLRCFLLAGDATNEAAELVLDLVLVLVEHALKLLLVPCLDKRLRHLRLDHRHQVAGELGWAEALLVGADVGE